MTAKEMFKEIELKKTNKYYRTCNCCTKQGSYEISFMKKNGSGFSGTSIVICNKHLKELKEKLSKIDFIEEVQK